MEIKDRSSVIFNNKIDKKTIKAGIKSKAKFIKKYGDRIVSLHIKDKTGPNAEEPNANQVWGQGQTPLEDVLLYLRDNKVPIFPDIELEYSVKPWSNSVKEVATCVKYARQILM